MNTTLLPLAAALLMPLPAAALSFSGSFSGIAHVSEMLGGNADFPAEFFDGAEVTGTFSANIPDAHLATLGPDHYSGLGGGQTELDFTMKGHTFSFPGRDLEWWPALMTVYGDADGQVVSFHSVFYSMKYDGGAFWLHSPAGGMFQDDDETTLRIGPDTVTGFDAYFKDSTAMLYVDIDIRSFTINAAPPVPEPPVWALAGLGLLALRFRARR